MKKPIKRCTGGRTLVLVHSGVKGMKHGVRQYQNRDGTWTELGKERRRKGNSKTNASVASLTKEDYDAAGKAYKKLQKLKPGTVLANVNYKKFQKRYDEYYKALAKDPAISKVLTPIGKTMVRELNEVVWPHYNDMRIASYLETQQYATKEEAQEALEAWEHAYKKCYKDPLKELKNKTGITSVDFLDGFVYNSDAFTDYDRTTLFYEGGKKPPKQSE